MRISQQGKIAGLVLGVFLWAGDAAAQFGSDSHPESPEAESHCASSATGAAALYGSTLGAGWSTSANVCPHIEASKTYTCTFAVAYNGVHQFNRSCCATGSSSNCNGPYYGSHNYVTWVDPCLSKPDITGITVPAISNADGLMVPQISNPYCHEGCTFNMSTGGQSGDCTYIDANNNGGVDEGEEGACPAFAYADPAGTCTAGDAFPTAPSGGAVCSGAQCTVAGAGTGPGGQAGQPGIPTHGGTTTTGSPGLPGAAIGDDDGDGTCEVGEECYQAGNRWGEAIHDGLVGDNDGAGWDTGLGPDDYLESGEGDAAGMFENAKKNRNRDDDKWEDVLQDYMDDAEGELSGVFVGAGVCPVIDMTWYRGWGINIDTNGIGSAMRGIIAWIMWISIGIWSYLYLYRAATKSE